MGTGGDKKSAGGGEGKLMYIDGLFLVSLFVETVFTSTVTYRFS